MEWTTLYVSSITNAMRGKTLLEKQGMTVHMQRAANPQEAHGCGYSLLVRGNSEQAQSLLKHAGIRLVGIANGGKRL